MRNKVRFVKDIRILKDPENPDKLTIRAKGIAEINMQINPVLIPKEYISEPTDGIYELNFRLDETDETSTPVEMEVEVIFKFKKLPEWVKGVRVNAEENSDIELI